MSDDGERGSLPTAAEMSRLNPLPTDELPARDVKVDVTDPFVNIERYERLLHLERANEWMAAKLADIGWLSWNCCDECGSIIRAELDKR